MKKILTTAASILMLAFVVNAQINTLTNTSYIVKGGGTNDTIIKDQTVNVPFYVSPYCSQVALQVNSAKISGYQKAYYILEKSFDNTTWVQIDTAKVSSSSALVKSQISVKDINAPYIRMRAVAIDSTQKVRYTYHLAIKKAN